MGTLIAGILERLAGDERETLARQVVPSSPDADTALDVLVRIWWLEDGLPPRIKIQVVDAVRAVLDAPPPSTREAAVSYLEALEFAEAVSPSLLYSRLCELRWLVRSKTPAHRSVELALAAYPEYARAVEVVRRAKASPGRRIPLGLAPAMVSVWAHERGLEASSLGWLQRVGEPAWLTPGLTPQSQSCPDKFLLEQQGHPLARMMSQLVTKLRSDGRWLPEPGSTTYATCAQAKKSGLRSMLPFCWRNRRQDVLVNIYFPAEVAPLADHDWVRRLADDLQFHLALRPDVPIEALPESATSRAAAAPQRALVESGLRRMDYDG